MKLPLRITLALLMLAAVALPIRAADNDKPAAVNPAAPLKVHLISACGEYKSEPSLKEFKEHLEKNYRVTCTASWSKDGATQLPDVDKLADAELMLVFARRMNLDQANMAQVRKHWQDGKPIVGIRTAGHAFQQADNELFDRQVLGGHYQGHYGNEPVKVENVAEHPILAGVKPFTSRRLYKAGPLAEGTLVLQTGDNGNARHPVSIVHTYNGGRVFFTALGVPEDFEDPNFRQMLTNAIFWTTHRDAAKMKKP